MSNYSNAKTGDNINIHKDYYHCEARVISNDYDNILVAEITSGRFTGQRVCVHLRGEKEGEIITLKV